MRKYSRVTQQLTANCGFFKKIITSKSSTYTNTPTLKSWLIRRTYTYIWSI